MSTPSEAAMQDRLVRVETKLDILIADMGPRHADHEARLRLVETTVAQLKVKVAMVAGGAGTASGIATALLAHLVGA